MCGISGFAGHGSSDALRRMGEALRRRGPDDEGFYEAPGVGFSFRRLSIIDVAGGHQPMSNQDASAWVMLNGEIYGYAALREELIARGHRFTTKSDTETIVYAYQEWGDACFERLQGMFAIAIWDVKKQRLVLARDRLGKKPLYWTVKDGTLWFASEIKALLAAGVVSREMDLVALGEYFRTDATSTPRSIFQNVSKLEPASAMSWTNGVVEKTWSFWSCPREMSSPTSEQDVVTGFRERFDAAVHDRLVSDVPLGLFLSGGLDSALVAESAARQASGKLQAYTIGFDDASHDESDAARIVAKAFGLEHHIDRLTGEQALSMLDEAVDVLDEPLADPAILPQLFLARFTRQALTVALSGDGGDELLLGYQHIPAHLWADRLAWLPLSVRSLAADLLRAIPAHQGYFSFGFKAQRLARGLAESDRWSRDVAWRGAFTRDTLSLLLLPDRRDQVKVAQAEEELRSRALSSGVDPASWKAWAWAYLRTYLMDDVLVKVDRATMWFSLEGRAPLLDTRVVEYLLCLPDEYKLGAWKNKKLFKECLKDKLPVSILDRPKHGFGVPVGAWLRGPLRDRLRALSEPERLRAQGLFDSTSVARLIDQHQAGKIDRRKELWAFFMFQLWYDRWFQA